METELNIKTYVKIYTSILSKDIDDLFNEYDLIRNKSDRRVTLNIYFEDLPITNRIILHTYRSEDNFKLIKDFINLIQNNKNIIDFATKNISNSQLYSTSILLNSNTLLKIKKIIRYFEMIKKYNTLENLLTGKNEYDIDTFKRLIFSDYRYNNKNSIKNSFYYKINELILTSYPESRKVVLNFKILPKFTINYNTELSYILKCYLCIGPDLNKELIKYNTFMIKNI